MWGLVCTLRGGDHSIKVLDIGLQATASCIADKDTEKEKDLTVDVSSNGCPLSH